MRYNLSIPDDMAATIRELSAQHSVTFRNVLLTMLRIGLLVIKTPGARLLVLDGDGEREVMLVW